MRPSALAKRSTAIHAGFFDVELEHDDDLLVDKARRGDADALDVLLKRYTSYARAKARTYFLVGADREDIVQEGMIGLFKAIRDFDSEKTVSFRSFAELCITRQIITAIKTATRQKHTPLNSYVSLHRPVMADDEGERQLSDFLASAAIVDPVDLVVAEDEVSQIRAFLSGILSDLEAEVLNMYLEGKSYQDIADSLQRQAKSIDNALQRIKRKLEQFLADREATSTEPTRVVHVRRFTPPAPAARVQVEETPAEEPRKVKVVKTAVVAKPAAKSVTRAAPAKRVAVKAVSAKPVSVKPATVKAVASRTSTTKGSKATAKAASTARNTGRSGDLRAGLRYAVAAVKSGGKAAGRATKAASKRGR